MILNATNAAKFIEESEFSQRAQCGIDLSVKKINKIYGSSPKTLNKVLKAKTLINPETYKEVELEELEGNIGWFLHPGTYDFQFNERVTLDNNHCALVLQRSSIPRTCGGITTKSLFDPGFSTKEHTIGTTFVINQPIFIEKDARVAQMVIFECEESEEYKGQFLGEKQKELIGK